VNVFPTLAGLGWPIKITPLWNNQLQKTVTGRVVAATYQQYPLYKFRLPLNFLTAADFDTLLAFFNAQSGNLTPFWFDAGLGNDAVANQAIGTGDGTTTEFTLLRSYGGFSEPVAASFGSPVLKVAGSAVSATFNSPSNGQVTAAAAPASGDAVTWTGNYYFQVRFAKGSAEIDEFMSQLYEAKQIDLETFF
jgi:uncharacterized protein (TIGR02217 family)